MSDEQQVSDDTAEATGGEQTQPGPEQQPGETAAQAARRWKLQVEGREEETDDAGLLAALIETHGEDGLRNIAQLSKAARRKMGELSHKEKQLLSAAEDLKDPRRRWSLLERIAGGRDALRAELEDWYAGDIEERKLSPEARRLKELEQRLSRYEEQEKRQREEEESRKAAEATQRYQQQIGRQFRDALAAHGIDEPTPHMMARMAALAEAELADVGSFDAREIAQAVAREYEEGEVGGLLRKLASNPEKLVKLLGQDGLRALRQHDIQQVKAKQAPAPAASSGQRSSTPRQERKRMSIDDYEAELQRRRG